MKKLIKKIAKEYAQRKYCVRTEEINKIPLHKLSQIHIGRDGFIAGAEWRINSVWHDLKDELPEYNKHVVNEDWFDFVAKDEKDLKRILKKYPFKRWAYVDDLLPGGKEDME